MRVLVLGSGAGGGVPQWNCRCPVCTIAWDDPARVRHRTQTSLAVSADGRRWMILDAAPELRQQIIGQPALHPRGASRHSPIAAVAVTSGEVDHIAGLLCLREGHVFSLFAARPALKDLAASAVFDVLGAEKVQRRTLIPDMPVKVDGLVLTPFAVPGKVPLYRESGEPTLGEATGSVIGLDIEDGAHRLCYVPGLAHLTPALVERLGSADLLFLDGTTYSDNELIDLSLSAKTAGRMGHLPMTGPRGSMRAFPPDAPARKVYIHINNTNPVLIEDSPEREKVSAAGWEVAYDGLEFVL